MSEVIRQRRQELGLSQADLARAAGTDARQIRRYEAGDVQPSFAQARAIAEALDITLDQLAGGIPLEGMIGTWWLAWKELQLDKPMVAQIQIVPAGSDYEARPLDPGDRSGLDPRWRMTFKRERDRGLLGWFVEARTIGVAVLRPMSPGWAGRWIGVPTKEWAAAGHIALSRVEEDLPTLLEAVVKTPN